MEWSRGPNIPSQDVLLPLYIEGFMVLPRKSLTDGFISYEEDEWKEVKFPQYKNGTKWQQLIVLSDGHGYHCP